MPRTIPAKTILSKVKNGPDPWFGISYNMNLYRGCQHQCIYCDSRSECYQLDDLADIRLKENALQILEKELKSKKSRGTIGFGSMNDPYMPVEKNEELVRGALKLLIRFNFPAHILTKSNLITRDIDLLQQLSKNYAAASLTITTADNELAKIIEPGAPLPSQRFDAIQQLAGAGIYTGVMLMPLLPFINDEPDDVERLIIRSKEAGAKYILFSPGLTLRKGSREYFYEKLDQHFPGIKQKYIAEYGDKYSCLSKQANSLVATVSGLCKKLGLLTKMDFFEENKANQLSISF